MRYGWIRTAFTMELRKIITYRADFWVNFIGNTSISLILAYFLWLAIFNAQDASSLNGFTMQDMILYYLMAPQLLRIQQGSGIGMISREIYEGALNKYILYPMDFYFYKIIVYLAHTSFYILQLFLLFFIYWLFMGEESILNLTPYKLFTFLSALYLCSLLYFCMSSICELIAFWADNIWSLSVIIRFSTSFLGGALIPLTFFPEWAQTLLNMTPFPYLIKFPITLMTKETQINYFLENIGVLILWTLLFFCLSKIVWRKGQYKYSGVGI